jgi:2-(1,2-epoxy-1,2-dihydrophenyl)acetyl-CoA isomerase
MVINGRNIQEWSRAHMTDQLILSQRRDNILTLTLNRPDKLNSLTVEMLSELGDALSEAAADDSLRVVVITGAGRGFCAGQDLRQAGAIGDGRAVRNVIERHYNPIIRQIRSLKAPVIAAVNGIAAGAGANLALACDLVVACETASFVQAFCRIGLIPDAGGTYFLPRLVGHARALGLALLGDTLDARKAADWGLIWQAVPDADFAKAIDDLAARLAVAPTAALALMKQALNASGHHSLEQQLATEAELQPIAAETEDFQEGIQAFLGKRNPNFAGR